MVLAELILVFTQLPFLRTPLTADESIYYTVAEHGMPYVATFDQKPPLIYVWYKLALVLNGGAASPAIIHLLAVSVLGVTAALVYALGRTLADSWFGAVAAITFTFLTANPFILSDANTETFALPWLVLSMLAFVRAQRRGSIPWYATSGALGAVAVLTKTTLVLPVALPALVLLGTKRSRAHLARLMGIAGGGLVVILIGLVPWLVTQHFGEFWYANVTFNLHYSSGVPLVWRPVLAAWGVVGASLGSLTIVAAIVLLVRLRPAVLADGTGKLLFLWLLGGILGVFATGLVLHYYLVALFPALALVSAAALVEVGSQWNAWSTRRLAYVSFLPASAIMIAVLIPAYSSSPEELLVKRYPIRGERAVVAFNMTNALSGQAASGDRLMVVGDGIQLYATSGLQPAARVFATPFLELDPGMLPETLAQVAKADPRILVRIEKDSPSEAERRTQAAFAPLFAGYSLTYSVHHSGISGTIWVRQ